MKKALKQWALVALFAAIPVFTQAKDEQKLKDESAAAVAAFKTTDPTLISFFNNSVGYVIFPSVGKGGLVVGGAHGKGLVYQKDVLIGEATLSMVSVGAQIGGQKYSEIIFFEDPATLDRFKEGNMELSAQLSAVAAAEGASKNAKYVNGVAIFTRAESGLMAEASVGGQKFSFKSIK